MEKEKKFTLLPNNIIIQLTFTLTFSKDILCCSPRACDYGVADALKTE